MIFVTVGTHNQPFDRLLKKIDELIENGVIKDNVIAQIGASKYSPKHYKYIKFLDDEKILELNKKAKMVITHAGAGSIIVGLKFNKPLILIPRLKEFNEAIDNHQVEIAAEFEKMGKVLVAYDVNDLPTLLKKIEKFKPRIKKERPKIYKIIKNFLEGLENDKLTSK